MARFQTTFKKTFLTLTAIAILIGLGTWQLERREWKTALIATMEARGKLPSLNQIPKDANYNDVEFRRVSITGLVDDGKFLFLGPRTQNGKAGYYMYVPMYLQDRRVILINQGFIANQYLNMVKPGSARIKAVTGTLRQPSSPGLFTPKNADDGNMYFWLDLMTIGSRMGMPNLLPVILELDSAAASQYSMGAEVHEPIENNHLQYALTWYALAFIAMIYYLMTSFRQQGVIEAGFRMRNHDLDQGLPFGVRNAGKPKTGNDKDDKPPSLW